MIGNPFPLKQNEGKSFIGSYVLGMGFVLSPGQASQLVLKNPRNKEVLYPYLNGEDLNSDPEQKPSRWVINFFDWTEEKARTYPDCFEILEQLVKPERLTKNDKGGREKWWQFLRPRKELYETISKLDQVMAINRHSKYLLIAIVQKDIVYSEATVVLALDSYYDYAVLSSSVHEAWAWKNSSTMKGDTLRYSASGAFETFPFPPIKSEKVDKLGLRLHTSRKALMAKTHQGLTEVQNLLHNHNLQSSDELYDDVSKLRSLQRDLDNTIIDIYGWHDIELRHAFYELEYLSENDRVRFSIDPNARKEILKRLSILNQEQYDKQVGQSSIIQTRRKIGGSSETIKLFPDQ